MSVYDPWGCSKKDSTYLHLYDESFQYLGVAWVNDLTIWAQAGPFAAEGAPKDPTRYNYPIDIALLSGPETATIAMKNSYLWPCSTPGQDVPLHESATFYRVMLLSRFSLGDHKPILGGYERVGLGEIRADMVEGWKELKWAEILLQ
jgi:hypothetical protein